MNTSGATQNEYKQVSISKEQKEVSAELGYKTLEDFLKFIEKRAFHMARLSTSHTEDAHDIVQDAMYKLIEKYPDKTPADWKPLFYRILQSKITDYYRRKALRDKVFPWKKTDDQESEDYLETQLNQGVSPSSNEPAKMLLRGQHAQQLSDGIEQLPLRQQQAFMLRCWEGLSTKETATAMGCTQGSVKTHYSRAMTRLRDILGDYCEQ
ncbi:RNA polymerase sigma factor [Gammaproteobacteria bacterium]|nr:RNA polymerase sigma factor [Gammaproteobacteria bacterium]|tara:strand:+ start:2498 stop:3124 length:627 start_codon:yes stop_codon:yes gene_type:complete